jgi:hypothetical protein
MSAYYIGTKNAEIRKNTQHEEAQWPASVPSIVGIF